MILNLPLEVRGEIFSYLPRHEQVNLRLVCQELRETISVEDPWIVRSGELPKEVQRSHDPHLYPNGIFFYTRKGETSVICPIESCVCDKHGDKPLPFMDYGGKYYFHVFGIFTHTQNNDIVNIMTGKTVLDNIGRGLTISFIDTPTRRDKITIARRSETDSAVYFKVINSEGIIVESPKYLLGRKGFKNHLYSANAAMFLYNDDPPGKIYVLIFKGDNPEPINIHIDKFIANTAVVKLGSTPWCQYVSVDSDLYIVRWERGWYDVERSKYRTLLVDGDLHYAVCDENDFISRRVFLLNLNNGEVFDIHSNITDILDHLVRSEYRSLEYDKSIPPHCNSFKIYRNYLIRLTPTDNTLTCHCYNIKTGSCRTLFEIPITDTINMYGTIINGELIILTRDLYVAVSIKK